MKQQTLTPRARLAKARRVKASRRKAAEKEARAAVRRITPRYRRLTAAYATALAVHGEGSPEEIRAWNRLLPAEGEWCRVALEADRLGVPLP